MSEESDSFAKPTGDHVILPNEKNFYFHAKQEPPRADIVVPGGQFAIEGIDKPNELPKTKARIAKQSPNGKNPIRYGGPSLESAVIVGGILLVVGFAASRKA